MRKDQLEITLKERIESSERRSLIAAGLLVCVCLAVLLLSHSWDLAPDNKHHLKVPKLSVKLPDFSQFADVKEKKRAFFDYLRPIVEQQNLKIRYAQAYLNELESRGNEESAHNQATIKKVKRMAKAYRVDLEKPLESIIAELKIKVNVIPESLVLVQAANESAWGTSRFATEANNLFGQWCFESGCGLVPSKRGEGKKHEVRLFDTPSASVASYMKNLNSHPAYKGLRARRFELMNAGEKVTGEALALELGSYSERKEEYTKELVNMIRQNNLD